MTETPHPSGSENTLLKSGTILVLMIVALLIGLAGGVMLTGSASSPAESSSDTDSPSDMPRETRIRTAADESQCFVGAVVPREEADVAAEIEGLVESIAVRVGDRVSEGDVLAVLDTRILRHRAAVAQADLLAAEAERRKRSVEAEQSKQEHARRSALGDLVSQEEIDSARVRMSTAEAALAVADAQVEQVQARLAEVQDSLERSTLRAPFPGRVSRRYLDPGARTVAGTPVVHLARLDNLLVRFAVPPELRPQLQTGTPIRLQTVDDRQPYTGTVEQIAPEIDTASHLIFIEARLETGDNKAPLFGAEARVQLGTDSSSDCLR